MSQFPIFKVNKLTNKKIETIYVFNGPNETNVDLNNTFLKEPENKLFDNIFDKEEINEIVKHNIDVIFIEQKIHIDDSIGIIKLKIFEAIKKEASMSEIYLYCLINEKLNPITIYQNLTQNDKLSLTKTRINQLILNIYDINGKLKKFDLPEKNQSENEKKILT